MRASSTATAETPTDAEQPADRLVSVKRSNGETEDDWIYIGHDAHNRVIVVKSTPDNKLMTNNIALEEFQQLNPTFVESAAAEPAKTPSEAVPAESAETSLKAASTPEDWQRIKSEAKEFFDQFENVEGVEALRQAVSRHGSEVQAAMQQQLEELGLTSDIEPAVQNAKADKAAQLVEAALPYPDDVRRGDRKDIDRQRASLAKMLAMSDEQFSNLSQDWQAHEVSTLHGEALAEDKNYKAGEQRKAVKQELRGLDEKYGGVLPEISALPLDKEPGGALQTALGGYGERTQKINAGPASELINKDFLKQANAAQLVKELEASLTEKYQAQGLSEAQIQAKLAESHSSLETWVKGMDGQTSALGDLDKLEQQGNKEKMLTAKRHKIGEYIGSALLMRAIKGTFERGKSNETKTEINVTEVLAHGIDHNGSRGVAGAETLRNGEKAGSLGGRVMAQLETARQLSRNEGTLMRSLIYLAAVERSLGDSFVSTWDAIPAERKKQARKKLMLGMAATSSAIARMSAKAAQKARKTAATGAAAGTIWLGNVRS